MAVAGIATLSRILWRGWRPAGPVPSGSRPRAVSIATRANLRQMANEPTHLYRHGVDAPQAGRGTCRCTGASARTRIRAPRCGRPAKRDGRELGMTGMQPDTSIIPRMIRAVRLESSLYEEVEHDRDATRQAALVVAGTSLAAGIGGGFALGVGGLIFITVASLDGVGVLRLADILHRYSSVGWPRHRGRLG